MLLDGPLEIGCPLITLPSTVQRIVLRLDLPHPPPRVSPARGPARAELEPNQSSPHGCDP